MMDSRTAIKGAIVFVVTFGVFVLAKQGTSNQPSNFQSVQESSPVHVRLQPETQVLQPAPTPSRESVAGSLNDQHANVENSSGASPSIDDGSAQIDQILSKWQQAIIANDADLESSYYAPMLTSYYHRLNVSNAFLEADKQAFIANGNRITSLSLDQISLQRESPTMVEMRFVKDVTWQNANSTTHKLIPSRLEFQQFDDGWKITGEEDYK